MRFVLNIWDLFNRNNLPSTPSCFKPFNIFYTVLKISIKYHPNTKNIPFSIKTSSWRNFSLIYPFRCQVSASLQILSAFINCRFGFCFNGISNIMGNLMPKQSSSCEYKRVCTFPKGKSSKVNIIVWLDIELINNDIMSLSSPLATIPTPAHLLVS